MYLTHFKSINRNFNEWLTSWTEVMLVHEGEGEGILCMQGALIGITSIHGIHHVRHLLPCVPQCVFALFSKLAAKANTKQSPECEPRGKANTSNKAAQVSLSTRLQVWIRKPKSCPYSGVKTTCKPLHRLVVAAWLYLWVSQYSNCQESHHFFYLGLDSQKRELWSTTGTLKDRICDSAQILLE